MDDLFDPPARPTPPTSTPAPQPPDDAFWSVAVVRMKTGLSRASIYRYVARGDFPCRRRIGRGRVAWVASEVNAWMVSRPRI